MPDTKTNTPEEKPVGQNNQENQTQPATDKPKEEAAPSPEEISQQADEFLAAFNYSPAKKEQKKKAEPKQEEKPAEPVKPEENKEEPQKEEASDTATESGGLISTPEKTKEGVKAEEKPSVKLTDDEIADLAAEKVIERQQQEREERPVPPEEFLSDEDREVLDAVSLMQENPRFKGRNLVDETKKFWNAEQAYMDKWEAEHDGETFDPKDKEHAAFYRKHALPFTDNDLTVAQRELERHRMKEEAKREVRQEFEPELNQLKFKDAYESERPKIAEEEDRSVVAMALTAVPEFGSILKDKDGKTKTIDKEVFEALKTADPLAVELLTSEAKDLRVRIEEAEKLARLGRYYKPNPDLEFNGENGPFRPHAEIGEIGERLEAKIGSLPKKDQIEDGRAFITRTEYRKQAEAIIGNARLNTDQKKQRIQALQDKHWMVDIDLIKQAMVQQSAAKVGRILKIAKKHFPKSTPEKSQQQTTIGAENINQTQEKPKQSPPPTTAGASDSVNTQIRDGSSGDTTAEEVVKSMFG